LSFISSRWASAEGDRKFSAGDERAGTGRDATRSLPKPEHRKWRSGLLIKESSMATIYTDSSRGGRDVPREETFSLIASDKVEGTAVYGPDGDKIGSIENVMIDKSGGRVAYAVLTFGGFLGMGNDYYPLPWAALKYDENLSGYRVNITRAQLETAPKYHEEDSWDWSDRQYLGQIDEHYKAVTFV
jgi:hypothetical protein